MRAEKIENNSLSPLRVQKTRAVFIFLNLTWQRSPLPLCSVMVQPWYSHGSGKLLDFSQHRFTSLISLDPSVTLYWFFCTILDLLSSRRSCCWLYGWEKESGSSAVASRSQQLQSYYMSWEALCDIAWALDVLKAVCWLKSAACVLENLWWWLTH